MMEYHPVLTTLFAFILGIISGILATYFLQIKWIQVAQKIGKAIWGFLKAYRKTRIRLVVERLDEKVSN